jgi:hypothetical protein
VGEGVPGRELEVLVDVGIGAVDETFVVIAGGIVDGAKVVVAVGWAPVGGSSFGVADVVCGTTGWFSVWGWLGRLQDAKKKLPTATSRNERKDREGECSIDSPFCYLLEPGVLPCGVSG